MSTITASAITTIDSNNNNCNNLICEKRQSKCPQLRLALHIAFHNNPDPSHHQLKQLLTQIQSQIVLRPNDKPLTIKVLKNWFKDRRRYEKRYPHRNQ